MAGKLICAQYSSNSLKRTIAMVEQSYTEGMLLDELNMKINLNKTVFFLCSKNYNVRARIHLQNNQEIEKVEEFAYLGSVIKKDGRSKRKIIM